MPQIDRRTFTIAAAAIAAANLLPAPAHSATVPFAKNVVLVHGLFADGSCWSEVIARLQAAGLNATAVQNPLTTLPEALASTQRVLARQDGPTVLVGHSFSGMIVTEAGMHPKVSALVYVAARAPDAGEDYTALAKTFPTPPAMSTNPAKLKTAKIDGPCIPVIHSIDALIFLHAETGLGNNHVGRFQGT